MSRKKPPALEIDNLEFGYDKPLLSIDHFQVSARETVAVLGPSGCGKTTFMHLIAGLLRPQQGTIRINGEDIADLTETAIDRIRGQHMGIVFQQLHLVPSISVIDNLLLAQRLARSPIDQAYAETLLDELGIEDLVNEKPQRLSQGQAQRVAIARAVVHRPSLVVADEPTSALDDNNAVDAVSVLRDLSSITNAALIVVTHDERVRICMHRVFDMGTVS